MVKTIATSLAVLAMALSAAAQTPAPAAAELTAMLNQFLAGASDAAAHEKFWADELVYTAAAGRRTGKADILKELREAPAPKPEDPKAVYTAEDVSVRQYGDTAVVAFRLIGTTTRKGAVQVDRYWNTGTFVKRSGRWQAVAWQATKIPK